MPAPLTYALHFRGEAVGLAPGRYWAEGRAAKGPFGTDPAVCRRELELRADGSFVSYGEIRFGERDSITFNAEGSVVAAPAPRLRHGTAFLEVTGGCGRLAGARGSIASQFLLDEAGTLDDHHLGLLFLKEDP